MKRRPGGIGAYTAAYLLAVALALISLALSRRDLGALQLPAAMAIATFKGALIALVFIGLARAPPSLVLSGLVALILSLAMLAFIILDVAMR